MPAAKTKETEPARVAERDPLDGLGITEEQRRQALSELDTRVALGPEGLALRREARGHNISERELQEIPENPKGSYEEFPLPDPVSNAIGVVYRAVVERGNRERVVAHNAYASLAEAHDKQGYYWHPWYVQQDWSPDENGIYPSEPVLRRGVWMARGYPESMRIIR